MKKLLALILVLVLCLPAMALADVLADDWQDASMEELLDAQQNISNRISELRAAAAADVERVELSGTGTAILSDVVIPFAPSRVKLTSEGSCTAKLTGGAYDYVFDGDSYEEKFFDQSGTFNLLVETTGAWSFVVEPVMDGGTLPLSGTGPFVSDFVELPAPMIVTVEGNKGSMNALLTNFIVKLNHQYKNLDAWQGDSLTNEMFTGTTAPFSADVILQPVDGRTQYCISVVCEPGVEWSITPKN